VLLRIYGPSSDSLICRPRELHTLHALSSQSHIGPKVYGTFENGRVEEYFDSVTLTPEDIRNKKTSRLIGARMAELHSVDFGLVGGPLLGGQQDDSYWEIGVKKNVESWLTPAREVLAIPHFPEAARIELDLQAFEQEWHKYMHWLSEFETTERPSRRVFSHNDAQCGNLLRLAKLEEGNLEHRQVSRLLLDNITS
jgi:choline kinase